MPPVTCCRTDVICPTEKRLASLHARLARRPDCAAKVALRVHRKTRRPSTASTGSATAEVPASHVLSPQKSMEAVVKDVMMESPVTIIRGTPHRRGLDAWGVSH